MTATLWSVTYGIAGVVVLVVVALAVVLLTRRRGRANVPEPADTSPSSAPARPEPEPMTGLEAALAQVTDRDGRPIGEHIDAEAPLVDDLRVPDDTGPVLRRALDRVEHQPTETADDLGEPARDALAPAGDLGEPADDTVEPAADTDPATHEDPGAN